MYRFTGTQVYSKQVYTGVQVYKYTHVYRYTGIEVHGCTGSRVHRCTLCSIQVHRYAGVYVHRCTVYRYTGVPAVYDGSGSLAGAANVRYDALPARASKLTD